MREIKFRAWGCHKVDYNWEIEDEYGYPLATYSKPSMIYFGLINGLDEMHPNPSELKFMQYTGLKDQINRNEIYEHDIINHLQYGFLKVEWDYENTGWCCLSKTYKKFRLVEILLSGGIRVGNIYENPELLKD